MRVAGDDKNSPIGPRIQTRFTHRQVNAGLACLTVAATALLSLRPNPAGRGSHSNPADEEDMPFKLPPLSSLRVFEAAARHGSFKKAAEELSITASAVSHAVQNLEDWLGVELFRRGGGKLELTEPGAGYGLVIGEAMKTIADATVRLPGRRSHGRLTINSARNSRRAGCCRDWHALTSAFPVLRSKYRRRSIASTCRWRESTPPFGWRRRRRRWNTGPTCWRNRWSQCARRRCAASIPRFRPPSW